MDKHKKWIILTTILMMLFATPFLYIAVYNAWIDPLWLYSHKHTRNDIQDPFDERLLKTHSIKYQKKTYNSLLLGSSRVTYINQDKFPEKTYNYGVSSMVIEEFEPYVSYAEEQNGKPFDTIYIGLDFWGTNVYKPQPPTKPDFYFDQIDEPFYRIKKQFSFSTKKYAERNEQSSIEDKILFSSFRAYNRENIATAKDVPLEKKKAFLAKYKKEISQEKYGYDSSYKEVLLELKRKHPDSKFVVFLTPVFQERWYEEFQTQGKWAAYERWTMEVGSVFGEYYNFMTPHPIVADWNNFYDSQHFYPHVGNLIIARLTGSGDVPDGFGVQWKQDTINSELAKLKPDQNSNM
jgi:hypothetical protein